MGFVYVLNYADCTLASSNAYQKFNNMGIRSVKLSENMPAGVAMLAYDNNGSSPGNIDNEYLIIGSTMDIQSPSTTYH